MTSVGRPVKRIEGRAKVLGKARFAAEYPIRGLVYAAPVLSTIPKGRVTGFDLAAAQAAPGVLAVITHLNAPKLPYLPQTPTLSADPKIGHPLRALQDDRVLFDRQYVAVVVADTLERAEAAAALVKVTYQAEPAALSFAAEKRRAFAPNEARLDPQPENPSDYQRGDPDAGMVKAAARIDATYVVPTEHHNPIEPHATIAVWSPAGTLTLYDKSQWPVSVRSQVARAFGLQAGSVRVLAPFVGGGFGGAGRAWPHVILTALIARAVKRPVKFSLSREQMYGTVGFRPHTEQRVRLGADAGGKLLSLVHEATAQTSTYEEYAEATLHPARMLYACDNVRTTYRLVGMNVSTPTFMRGPGEATGAFALESAMDELAVRLNLDPVELRLRNHAEADPEKKLPWSSKSLRQCYADGAERIGWTRRTPAPGSMRDGRLLVGLGMATAVYPANRTASSAKVLLLADGSAVVHSSSSDMGPGTYTSMAQVAADALGLDVSRVRVEIGDTEYPFAPVQGGSQMMASLGPAVMLSAQEARRKAVVLALSDRRSPLYGLDPAGVTVQGGRLFAAGDPSRGETYAALLARLKVPSVEGHQTSGPGSEKDRYSFWSFGAHFVEVTVDPDVLETRVRRVVSSLAVGRVINPRIAHSQALGGVIGGLGMALLEETRRDDRYGRVTNANLSEYLVPVNADVPRLEPAYVEEVEPYLNPLGGKGLGELPIVGVAAAVANAVYHATGKRVRDLPIGIEKLL
ncbi:xanthine dehydrogenase family protein molybdopterin-binding subunit [uncultured Deinococcus sp.]|uniref:xanthine dehydrogenase family protein molybdopterin-binding subunit n=1 Tax=uncultured Deinococcus sp. TaxID=158789 RepID=UPI0025872D48|nr:xanthine dehydrogenase family protein molybdopterin-binding subunit [uncultured Deinococcus sp.]